MTQYFRALKRLDGRWDYTSSTGSSAQYPRGYCAGWREAPIGEEAEKLKRSTGQWLVDQLAVDIEAKRAFASRYHTNGHETCGEADECYRQYRLDHELEFHEAPTVPDTLHKCQGPGCLEYTAGVAFFGQHRHFYLCETHRTREVVEGLVG